MSWLKSVTKTVRHYNKQTASCTARKTACVLWWQLNVFIYPSSSMPNITSRPNCKLWNSNTLKSTRNQVLGMWRLPSIFLISIARRVLGVWKAPNSKRSTNFIGQCATPLTWYTGIIQVLGLTVIPPIYSPFSGLAVFTSGHMEWLQRYFKFVILASHCQQLSLYSQCYTVCDFTLHYITLHYITLHYIEVIPCVLK